MPNDTFKSTPRLFIKPIPDFIKINIVRGHLYWYRAVLNQRMEWMLFTSEAWKVLNYNLEFICIAWYLFVVEKVRVPY